MRNRTDNAARSSAPYTQTAKFSDIEELISDQRDVAIIIKEDADTPGQSYISAYKEFNTDSPSEKDISYAYLSACDPVATQTDFTHVSLFDSDTTSPILNSDAVYVVDSVLPTRPYPSSNDTDTLAQQVSVFVKHKYKPVSQKIRPIIAELPDKFRIVRNIVGDPLADLPTLSPNPPSFRPTGRYTAERRAIIKRAHPEGFLLPAERELMHHFMCLQEMGFAWDDSERGRFREDFFPPVIMPVVEHKPWVLRNMPIPPGIYADVCKIIQTKIDAGVYERSNSSYRSRWFTVLKKGGTALRIVHSLEPLNAVTIQHSGVPPFTEQLAEHFASRSCGGICKGNLAVLRLITQASKGGSKENI
jgi:hypothetical protein